MKYRLVFNGELTGNVPKSDCLVQLSKLFGKDSGAIATKLFRGKPIVVKQTSDAQVASRFMTAFEKAGAVLRVEAPGLSSVASESSLSPVNPEVMETDESPDTQVTRLRPVMRRVEAPPVHESPKLSDNEKTRRRQTVAAKDDLGSGRSRHS